jgi:hypothetical protein
VSERKLTWAEWSMNRTGRADTESPDALAARALLKKLKEYRRLRSQAPRAHDSGTDLRVPAHYPTIQAAVDAALPDDTVRIAAGGYFEQTVIVGKTNLTIIGEPCTVLHATTDMEQTLRPWAALPAVLGIVQSHVQLVGLTIDGDHQGSAYSGGGLQGVFYLGSSGLVADCKIRGFRGASLDGHSSARALVVWNPESAGADGIEVNIVSNSFEDNEQSITLAGDDAFNPTRLRTTFTVEANTITGFGPAPIAVDGVVVYTGAGGLFRGNTITDHRTGTGDPYATGINAFDSLGASRDPAQFIPLQAIRFEGNTFRNNNDHLVLLNAANSEIVNNVFEGSGAAKPRWGALAISAPEFESRTIISQISRPAYIFLETTITSRAGPWFP